MCGLATVWHAPPLFRPRPRCATHAYMHLSAVTQLELVYHLHCACSNAPAVCVLVRACAGASVNKQLGDKERVAAALENAHLLEVVNRCVRSTETLEPATAPDAPKT